MYAIQSMVFVFRGITFEIHKIKFKRFKDYSLNFDFKNKSLNSKE